MEEALFLYLGKIEEIGFDGAVASMCLKWIREGIEDYEYIRMLKKIDGEKANGLLHQLVRNMSDWEISSSVLYNVRKQIGEILDKNISAGIWRNGSFYKKYYKIQDAINESISGDVIKIYEGRHYEILEIIGKKNVTIVPKNGNVTVSGAKRGKFNWNFYSNINGKNVYCINYSEISSMKPNNIMIFIPSKEKLLWSYGSWDDFISFHAGEGHFYDANSNILYIYCNDLNETIEITKADYVIRIRDSTNCKIINISFEMGGESVIRLRNSPGNIIESVIAKYGQHGIWIKSLFNCKCSNNIIRKSTFFTKYGNWTWNDFKEYDSRMEGAAVMLEAPGENNVIENNVIFGYFDGISLCYLEESESLYHSNTTVRNNTIFDIIDDAIELDFSGKNVIVSGNRIYDVYCGLSFCPVNLGPIYVFGNFVSSNKKILIEDGLSYGAVLKMGDSRNIKIYHNTFHGKQIVMGGS